MHACAQGVLFGPMLVYLANLIYDLGKAHVREPGAAQGHTWCTPTPRTLH